MILITKNVKSKAAKERLKLFASIYLAALKLGVEGKFVLRMLMWEESKVNEEKKLTIFATIVNREQEGSKSLPGVQ